MNHEREAPMCFKEEIISEVIVIPAQKPKIEKVLNTLVCSKVSSVKIVSTEKGVSNEGITFTGNKAMVELFIEGKITYVTNDEQQSIHGIRFKLRKNIYIVLPEKCREQELLNEKRVNVTSNIEGVYTRRLDNRKVYTSMVIFVGSNICN